MTIIVPFRREHLLTLKHEARIQQAQTVDAGLINEVDALAVSHSPSYTMLDGTRVIACAGGVQPWLGRWVVWSVMSCDAKHHLLRIVRAAQRFIEVTCEGRLEAPIRADFAPGQRLAEMLGFEPEAKLKRFMPDGGDAILYVRFI